jgi:hypothetical protein
LGTPLGGTHWEPKEQIENLKGTHWELEGNMLGTKAINLGVGTSQILPHSLVLNTVGKQPGMPHTFNTRLNGYLLTYKQFVHRLTICVWQNYVRSKALHIAMVGEWLWSVLGNVWSLELATCVTTDSLLLSCLGDRIGI